MKPNNKRMPTVLSLLALAGCVGSGNEGGGDARSGETGLAIAAAVNTGDTTDVSLMRYSITRVPCAAGEAFDPVSRTITVPVQPLPALIPAFENSPLDKSSSHPFAGHFEVVPAGCYSISARPLTADSGVSADCASAHAADIQVEDGQATEVFLINQCTSPKVGAIEATVAFNQPPQILDVDYSACVPMSRVAHICATGRDPNGNPIQFDWRQISGGAAYGPAFVSSEKNPEMTTQCVGVLPMDVGDYLFEVRMYDMFHDEHGKLTRFETWLDARGYPNTSHDSLRIPLHVGPAPATD
jgi:hypothetical protein